MVEVKNSPDKIMKTSIYRIADMAGASSPDNDRSPGYRWLERVRDRTADLVADESVDDGDIIDGDRLYEEADSVVPIYTHELWTTWTDLGGYRFDGELRQEFSGDDIERIPQADLYEMAENAMYQLINGDY